jgi:hypothetical protein
MLDMGLLKNTTDASIVKNLRVVVMMEHGKGPKSATVKNIKYWKSRKKVRIERPSSDTGQLSRAYLSNSTAHRERQQMFNDIWIRSNK